MFAFSSDYKLVQVIIYINTFQIHFSRLLVSPSFETSAAASSSLVLLPNGAKRKSFLSLTRRFTQAKSLAQALESTHSIQNVCKSSFN